VTNFRMFSESSLNHFRRFVAADAADRARSGKVEGAFDETSKELRLALDAAAEESGAAIMDPDTISAILKLVSEVHGEDSTAALMKTLHQKWPGICGEMPGAEDSDQDNWTPQGQFQAAQGKGAMDDDPYDESGQFKMATMDNPGGPVPFKGMPLRGGKMEKQVAQDAAIRFKTAEALIRGADAYNAYWPEACRIRVM
jgi:hypothetical protein